MFSMPGAYGMGLRLGLALHLALLMHLSSWSSSEERQNCLGATYPCRSTVPFSLAFSLA